jgi:hypothetical protein
LGKLPNREASAPCRLTSLLENYSGPFIDRINTTIRSNRCIDILTCWKHCLQQSRNDFRKSSFRSVAKTGTSAGIRGPEQYVTPGGKDRTGICASLCGWRQVDSQSTTVGKGGSRLPWNSSASNIFKNHAFHSTRARDLPRCKLLIFYYFQPDILQRGQIGRHIVFVLVGTGCPHSLHRQVPSLSHTLSSGKTREPPTPSILALNERLPGRYCQPLSFARY